MMHNFRKRVGYYLILLALVCTSTGIIDVDAKQNIKGTDEAADKACNDALFSGDMLTSNEQNQSIKINAKEGQWKIKYAIEYDSTSADYSLVLGNKAKPTVVDYVGGTPIEIPVGSGNAIFLIAEPVADKDGHIVKSDGTTLKVSYKKADGTIEPTTCKAGNIEKDKSNKITINNTGAYILKKFKGTSKVSIAISETENPEEYQSCLAMQLGKLEVDDETSYLSSQDDLAKYNEQMKKSFPYCYGSYSSSVEVSKTTIDSVRKKSLSVYKQYLELLSAKQDNGEYTKATEEIKADPDYKYLKYSDKGIEVGKLSCTKEQLTQRTEKFYTTHDEVSNNLCSVKCQEQLQVTYDPPEATAGGLCFQYKVTVRSKVTCHTTISPNLKWPTPPTTCDFSPICEGNEQETQAGPNEEFDACIKKCDGGKYSQSCINSCYKKVYSKNKSTSSSTVQTSVETTPLQSNSNNTLRLSNKSKDRYYQIEGCKTNAQIKAETLANPTNSKCAKAFYKLKQQEPMGSYQKSDKFSWYNYQWTPDTSVEETKNLPEADNWIESIKRSSPYYFRNYDVALKTIQSFYGVNNGYNGYGEARTYIIDNNGIKRQRTNSYNCSEICGYIANEAECKSSNKELRDYYDNEYGKIEKQLSNCTSKATCKEDTSTFNMSVDNEVMKDKKTQDDSKWKATNRTNNDAKTCINPDGDIQMFVPILPSTSEKPELLPPDLESGNAISECNINPNNGINGKCYGKDNSNYWQHYKTTITFPGTWFDLKHSKRVYQSDQVNEDTMKEKPNYYCVGWDYEPVNEAWWHWKINGVGDINTINIEKNDNIQAKISKFGKYNWNINVNCFYGLSNLTDPPNCPPSDPDYPCIKDDCIGEECYTTITNIKTRPVDQADLFAGRTGNQIGFNWTSAAQDKVAAGTSYGINPGEYAEQLQAEAANNSEVVYSGTTDYSLHLTKENIKNLRNYVREHKEENGYTSYLGSIGNPSKEGLEGLYYYKSKILENDYYISNFKRKDNILGINND